MRCLACDKRLTDYESTVKDAENRYVDLCTKCFSFVKQDVQAFGNPALLHVQDEDVDNEDEGCYNNYVDNEEDS